MGSFPPRGRCSPYIRCPNGNRGGKGSLTCKQHTNITQQIIYKKSIKILKKLTHTKSTEFKYYNWYPSLHQGSDIKAIITAGIKMHHFLSLFTTKSYKLWIIKFHVWDRDFRIRWAARQSLVLLRYFLHSTSTSAAWCWLNYEKIREVSIMYPTENCNSYMSVWWLELGFPIPNISTFEKKRIRTNKTSCFFWELWHKFQ